MYVIVIFNSNCVTIIITKYLFVPIFLQRVYWRILQQMAQIEKMFSFIRFTVVLLYMYLLLCNDLIFKFRPKNSINSDILSFLNDIAGR